MGDKLSNGFTQVLKLKKMKAVLSFVILSVILLQFSLVKGDCFGDNARRQPEQVILFQSPFYLSILMKSLLIRSLQELWIHVVGIVQVLAVPLKEMPPIWRFVFDNFKPYTNKQRMKNNYSQETKYKNFRIFKIV